jgi:hypothetical protein
MLLILQHIVVKMLSAIIKKMIEEKAGIEIQSSRDCNSLAQKIQTVCKSRLSPSTIRKLFGIGKGDWSVRSHTLDVIGTFVGYPSYDELVESFNEDRDKLRITRELRLTGLRKAERIKYTSDPNIVVSFTCMGKQVFRVDVAKNSVLKAGDLFQGRVLKYHQPFFIFNVTRGEQKIEKLVEGRISGIESVLRLS